MKRTTLALLFFSLFIVSCGNSNSPKGVALTFLTNMSKMNYPEAKKFATPQTQQYIDKMGAFGGKMGSDDDYSPIIILRDSVMDDRAPTPPPIVATTIWLLIESPSNNFEPKTELQPEDKDAVVWGDKGEARSDQK